MRCFRDPHATDDKALRAFVSRGTSTYYHPVGSCTMGMGADAVVDAELRVHGLSGVRVADASVIPRIPPVNTNAAAIMIGERAADLIRYSATDRDLTGFTTAPITVNRNETG